MSQRAVNYNLSIVRSVGQKQGNLNRKSQGANLGKSLQKSKKHTLIRRVLRRMAKRELKWELIERIVIVFHGN